MTKGKVVLLTHRMVPEQLDIFLAEAPANIQVVVVDPSKGEEHVAEEVQDADFVVTYFGGRVSEQLLERAKRLKLVQTTGQGTNHIAVSFATKRGIYVANTGGANALPVAEFTVLLMLATMRKLPASVEALRQGKLQAETDTRHINQLYEKTVGIVGLGNIGRRVAQLVYGLGNSIIFYEKLSIPSSVTADFRGCSVSLEELLSSADIVTLHVPLLEDTRQMIGWKQLTMMKSTAFLINTSRGEVVDEAALIRALQEKRIAGAGLDVFEKEPPSPNNPLLHMDNVVATPHVAAVAWESWTPRVKAVWNNLVRVYEGKEPLNAVRGS